VLEGGAEAAIGDVVGMAPLKLLREPGLLQDIISEMPIGYVAPRYREVALRHWVVPDLVTSPATANVFATAPFEMLSQLSIEVCGHSRRS
jgi:hypothetical protein